MTNKKKIENAAQRTMLSSMHHRSCVDVSSILPTPLKKGFTLAEVLITLSIVGVVAVLTVPSIMKNYRYKAYATSLKKTYSQITDAVQAIMNEEMTTEFHKTTAGTKSSSTTGAEYFLNTYFKVAAKCNSNLNTECLGQSYKSFFSDDAGRAFGEACIRTTNGATICLTLNPANGITSVFIDVNGPADPNIVGLDTFVANIDNTGSVTDWESDEKKCNTNNGSGYGHVADYAAGCLTQIMNNGWVIDDTKWVKVAQKKTSD